MAKNDSREKTLSALAGFDEKISKHEKELKALSDKRQTLFSRTIISEMKMRNLTLEDFFSQMDKIDNEKKSTDGENSKSVSDESDSTD